MKNSKAINVEALLANLDSNELKAFRSEFNQQVTASMHQIQLAEMEEMRVFVDGLTIHQGWYSGDVRNVVSLRRYELPKDQRNQLREISDKISQAFHDLDSLKSEVAREAKRTGIPNSRMFHTTVKRMKAYKDKNPRSLWS